MLAEGSGPVYSPLLPDPLFSSFRLASRQLRLPDPPAPLKFLLAADEVQRGTCVQACLLDWHVHSLLSFALSESCYHSRSLAYRLPPMRSVRSSVVCIL